MVCYYDYCKWPWPSKFMWTAVDYTNNRPCKVQIALEILVELKVALYKETLGRAFFMFTCCYYSKKRPCDTDPKKTIGIFVIRSFMGNQKTLPI